MKKPNYLGEFKKGYEKPGIILGPRALKKPKEGGGMRGGIHSQVGGGTPPLGKRPKIPTNPKKRGERGKEGSIKGP